MSLIPHDASTPVKDGFRAVWKAINALDLQRKDVDVHGHRITNAGDGRTGSDYVTLRQIREISKDPHVVTQVRIIQETLGVGPWIRVGTVTQLVTPGDQVTVGVTGPPPSTTPKIHIRNAAAASFPTIGAQDFFVFESSGSANIAMIGGATGNMAIKFFGSGDTADDGIIQYGRTLRQMTFGVAATNRVRITSTGSVHCAVAGAIATTATDGFLYLPSCAGVPTGTPTAATGMIPFVIDSTNSKAYIYSGGAWVALN